MTKSLIRYHVTFGISLIVIMIILAIVGMVLRSGSTVGVSSVSPFLAATVVAGRFLKRERRIPTPTEKNKLVWGGMLIFFMFNAILLAILLYGIGPEGSMLLIIIGLFFAATALLNFFLMRWAYGGLLAKRAKKLNINPDQTDVFN